MKPRRRRKLDLGRTLVLLPNIITMSSIFCGFNAARLAARGDEDDFYRAAIFLIFAAICDTLDGRVARMTKTQSAFGVQIDSLADVTSFGVAPALLVQKWTSPYFPRAALVASALFVMCGAIRLARFNVLTTNAAGVPQKPGKYILGLPIPGAAGILVSLVLAEHAVTSQASREAWSLPLIVVTVGLSALMVSTVRFRSFKDVKLNAATVTLVAFAVGSSAVISTRWKPAFVLIWLLGIYVGFGLLEAVWQLTRSRPAAPPDGPPPPAP